MITEIWIPSAECRVFEFQFNLIFCTRHVRVPDFVVFGRYFSTSRFPKDSGSFGEVEKGKTENLKELLSWGRSQHNEIEWYLYRVDSSRIALRPTSHCDFQGGFNKNRVATLQTHTSHCDFWFPAKIKWKRPLGPFCDVSWLCLVLFLAGPPATALGSCQQR